jgi:hypothetical protein
MVTDFVAVKPTRTGGSSADAAALPHPAPVVNEEGVLGDHHER